MSTKTIRILLTLPLVLFVSACATQKTASLSQPNAMSASDISTPSPYVIQPGDQLDIKFFYNPELNESVTVRPDGKISLQLIDEVQAAGRSVAELDEILTKDYSTELKKPAVTVIVKSFTAQRVYVGGEVNRQGLIDLTAGMTPLQAVLNAGGFMETANPEEVIIIRKGPDNKPVPIRVDLEKAIYGKGKGGTVQLHPCDVVYVPKTFIAEANKFVTQYIQNLLMFRGVSLGFSYQLNDYYNRR